MIRPNARIATTLAVAAFAILSHVPRAAVAAAPAADSSKASRAAHPGYSPAHALSDSLRAAPVMPDRPAPPPARAAVAPDTTNGPPVPADVPPFWRTRAELSAWRQTSDADETARYCRQLEAGSDWVKVLSFGRSPQGRNLPLMVVSKDRAFTPAAARATGKPVVLILNGIHPGEIEGKDASLALVRDMAVLHSKASLLDSCIVLVVPIFSVDGHERHGRFNRINQNGPEEMGWRATAQGLNLNRDWVKADAPEMRAFLANVYTAWWPELLVDDHTTDGADYRHDVTWAYAHGPGVPPSIEHWLATAFEGRVVPALAAMGHLPAPYLSFRRADPAGGIDFGDMPPRFSTTYATLQCRAAILVETHMLKPYGTRVRATYDLLAALLAEVHARPRELTRAVADAERAAAAPGGHAVVLASHTGDRSVPFQFHGKATTWERSEITGGLVPHYSSAPWDTIIPLYRDVVPDLAVQPPTGYVIPQEWSDAIDLLALHGIAVRRLAKPWRDSVEVCRVLEWHFDAEPYEGHHPLHVTKVAFERRLRSYRPGDVWVPLAQRGGALAVNLCEAQAPDGLLAWNAFDNIFTRKEYGEDYVVEPMARKMLAADPALAKEFAARLASDTSFAASPQARTDFFYRRSPWADPEQNLVPVVRALHPVPDALLAPAAAAQGTPPR